MQQVFALNPQLVAFSSALWFQSYLPATTLELCRLRIARLLPCMPEFMQRHAEAVGMCESLVTQIDADYMASDLSPRHKLILTLTDRYLNNPHGLSDEDKRQ